MKKSTATKNPYPWAAVYEPGLNNAITCIGIVLPDRFFGKEAERIGRMVIEFGAASRRRGRSAGARRRIGRVVQTTGFGPHRLAVQAGPAARPQRQRRHKKGTVDRNGSSTRTRPAAFFRRSGVAPDRPVPAFHRQQAMRWRPARRTTPIRNMPVGTTSAKPCSATRRRPAISAADPRLSPEGLGTW